MKELGSISKLKVDTDNCFIPFKSMDMDLNKLVVLVGTNSSGKSVLNKLIWSLNFIMNVIVDSNISDPKITQSICQEVLDGTFLDQDINGKIHIDYDCGSIMSIFLDKGRVINFNSSYEKGITYAAKPIYMSTETRKISYTANYMKFKKSIGITRLDVNNDPKKLMELKSQYRIYDYLFMEHLIDTIKRGIQNTTSANLEDNGITNLQKSLITFDKGLKKIEKVFIDEENCKIMVQINGVQKDCNSLGAGEQSLLTMIIGAL